jgi:hypothetical protein
LISSTSFGVSAGALGVSAGVDGVSAGADGVVLGVSVVVPHAVSIMVAAIIRATTLRKVFFITKDPPIKFYFNGLSH